MTEPAVLQHPCLVPLVRCFGIRLTGSTRCCPWTLAFNIKTALRQPTNTRIRFEISPDNTAYKLLVLADRKSTRLNSSHVAISYAVFSMKKKTPLSFPHYHLSLSRAVHFVQILD